MATTPIADDEFLFLCPQDHPLAKRNDLAPQQIDSDEMLLLEDGHCLREHALSACKVAPGKRSAEVGATSLHTLVQMASPAVHGRDVAAEDRGRRRRGGRCRCRHASVRGADDRTRDWRGFEAGRPAREQEARILADVLRIVRAADLGGRPIRLDNCRAKRQSDHQPNRRPDVAEQEDGRGPERGYRHERSVRNIDHSANKTKPT
ncbi:MAG: LysR substrate-binding domain-containing protein [Hyphomonadaceae bacterium]